MFDLSRHPSVVDFITNVSPRVAHNRNNLVREFRETDADALLFLDDDMMIKPAALDKLIERFDVKERPVVGGLCFGLDSGLIFTTLHKVSPVTGKYVRVGAFPRDGLLEVDGTGGACLLVARHVFDKVAEGRDGYPWFAEEVIDGLEIGEDIVFCRRVKDAGFPIFIATGAHIVHIKDHVAVGVEQYVDQVDKRKYVFTGVGDGLYYFANMMQHLNLTTGFESVFVKGVVEPRWGAYRGDASRFAVPFLEHFKGEVFHVIAHPLSSIPGLVADGISPDIKAAAVHWANINKEVERWATARIPVEVADYMSFNKIGWEVGTPRQPSRIRKALDAIPPPVLAPAISWNDIPTAQRKWVQEMSRRYGYAD